MTGSSSILWNCDVTDSMHTSDIIGTREFGHRRTSLLPSRVGGQGTRRPTRSFTVYASLQFEAHFAGRLETDRFI
jgi:hypothetical protein